MDITDATMLASAIVALLSPVIVQVAKTWVPANMTELFSLAVSLVLGVLAIAATNGFTDSWGVVLAAVVGVAQTVYALINAAFHGELSRSNVELTD